MKSIARFLAWAVFSGILCFAPYVLGQSSVRNHAASTANSRLSYAPASFLTLMVGPGSDHRVADRNGNSGCSNQGVRDRAGRGDGSWGGGGGCTSVPEGGTAAIYLALAGLCCFGAMVWRSRRQTGAREIN
jgi:hypothetical protein